MAGPGRRRTTELPHTVSLRPLIGVVAVVAAIACRSDSVVAAGQQILVQITTSPAAPEPGGIVMISVSAAPIGADPLRWLRINVSGLATVRDSVAVSGPGSATISRVVQLPMAPGFFKIVGSTVSQSGNTGSAETTVTFTDTIPPTLTPTMLTTSPPALQPGDTIRFVIRTTDNIGILYSLVRATGAFTATDSLTFPVGFPSVSRNASIVVPSSVPLGSTIQLTAETRDLAGIKVTKSLGLFNINDEVPPVVYAQLTGAQANGSYAPGSTAQLSLSVSDNTALRRVGGSVPSLGIADSATASGRNATFMLTIPLPAGASATYPVNAFAVDSIGNRTEFVAGYLVVDVRTRRAMVSASLDSIRDFAIDSKRGVVYASHPSANRIEVLSLTTAAVGTPIPTAARPAGIDLTLGGDSLVVALPIAARLAFVNLVTGFLSSAGVPMDDQSLPQRPDNVRVAANNRVVYTMTFPGTGNGGAVRDFDLRLGTSIGRIDSGELTPLALSGNRLRVLGLIDDSCCPVTAFLYDATKSQFGPLKGTVNRYFSGVAADYLGNTFAISSTLFYTQALAIFKNVHAPNMTGAANALSPDATTAYLATSTGVARVRVSDDTVLETFALDGVPRWMRISIDGLTLVVATVTTVYVIDLW